ncbi:MAG: bifunctional DNA-formamidopyrimidine glycosylase/DNA-(apurinic or apyrimidinic site) lyase [Candidatus Marinimicrobia bacterium]|jgi:formamidopyrimidine-DNA glycosylase|nr:bifunctional DNA-formamidopyrimidine glycosylase/DNA-(apurinic or apyrimidinic site) lyase [Candidatus Neomarinimicrobiota bacterium]MBT4149518.1 bifunctional DNA-formamidopyrimidine glycosylase/DNA-(apurinic or apyrimidinic site) lyase [Candidatus Neomarinimicrobiota bacterium]MBT5440248.1 bifunctional DNA-formamidopyrimidine glycosylase/DNA-(apurinic or apyrimidinic site) lyase [Candidatus Neomarinimicrobiota bacterium]MBT7423413.1 bifunctional DNA-formamidopyrimidine glycosylase/DNA-(apuri|tara:strand:+ start:1134 stop:1952 length:819 start_codon:yes stop_codon:yes gene_type:complete
MPELPEVQSVVNHFKPYLLNQFIHSIDYLNNYEKVFETHSSNDLNKHVANQKISKVWRRGKYIVIDVSNGHLCIHLRMTGQLQVGCNKTDNTNHFTALINLKNKSKIYFKDYRKFGRIYFFKDLSILNYRLGPEPFDSSFNYKYLKTTLAKSRGMIKPKLLNQMFIAGLGNIYVDEVLWQSKIHPEKPCNKISGIKIKRLFNAIPIILQKSIKFNGTTIINFSPGNKTKGEFANYLNVFGKQGQSCPKCDTIIRKIFVSQRGTHFCPKCQKL